VSTGGPCRVTRWNRHGSLRYTSLVHVATASFDSNRPLNFAGGGDWPNQLSQSWLIERSDQGSNLQFPRLLTSALYLTFAQDMMAESRDLNTDGSGLSAYVPVGASFERTSAVAPLSLPMGLS
jgi:hypothetical protein